jgi:hypothetical protein
LYAVCLCPSDPSKNSWGTVNHETGIKDMKCAPPILFPKLERTIPESPCLKLGADYAVSMVGCISGDATYPLLIRSNVVSEDGYAYCYSYWLVSVKEC